MTADIITLSRIPLSLLLFVFQPHSGPFALCYLLCGASDMLDGFIARRLHTASEKGAKLDTAADLFFAAVYAVRILPLLSVPAWIWIWTAVIAAGKLAGILYAGKKAGKLSVAHSFGNKLTGLLLFLLPLSVGLINIKYGASVVCIAATGTVIGEYVRSFGKKQCPYKRKEGIDL